MFRSLLKACRRNALDVLKRYKGGAVNSEVLQKLDEGYANLLKSDSRSLLKKHLTPELFEKLKTKRTKTSTLLDCIQSGLTHHDSACGIYAACPQCYKVFAELFDPIIEDSHFGFRGTNQHPLVDFGDPGVFEDVDPNNNFIASTRLQCARSLQGYPFNPVMTVDHYNEIEDKLHCISFDFKGEYKGQFHSLCCLDKVVRTRLLDDHCLQRADDRFLVAANAYQYWPTGRGIFRNFDRTFFVLCNGEDHLTFISMQRGGNFAEVYARLIGGLVAVEKSLPFVRDDRLGFLTFCPTNLGTAIRASVRIKIPKLAANKTVLDDVARRYKLQIRGIERKHAKAEGGLYDISNSRRLGLTEFDALSELYCGIREIIQLEQGEMELPVVKRQPQAPPPHIDPQKAVKSGLIDERKKKWPPPPAKCVKKKEKTQKPTSKTTASKPAKDTLQMPVEGKFKNSKKSVESASRKPELKKSPVAAGQPTKEQVPKKSTPKKEPAKSETKKGSESVKNKLASSKRKAGEEPTAIVSKSESTCFSKKSQKTSSKKTVTKSDTSKEDRKKALQSTDPCTRAGMKKPKVKETYYCKRRLEKKNKIPKMCKNLKTKAKKSISSESKKCAKKDTKK